MKPVLSAEKELLLGMSDEQVVEIFRRAGLAELMGYQHSAIDKVRNEKRSTALAELNGLVGMEETKRQLNKLIAFFRMQKIAIMRGITASKVNSNMVFVGNPGTGKTEGARIFAKLLAEVGITKKELFIECGRADIVAKYAGHTAKNVKALVKKALGGVLFIDEAYSLCEESERGNFGEEAINTLLQEVENHRGELVVILAGYPRPMQEFLDSNPGLKSRFPNVIQFPDYSAEELYEISAQIAKRNGFCFSQDVKEKLIPIFNNAIKIENYGNARFARNMVETAELNLAENLSKKYKDLNQLTNEQLFTLTAKEFDMPHLVEDYVTKRKMGFGFN